MSCRFDLARHGHQSLKKNSRFPYFPFPNPPQGKKTDTKEINKKTHKTRNSWEQLCFKGHQNHWIESTAKKDDRRHPELHRIGHQCWVRLGCLQWDITRDLGGHRKCALSRTPWKTWSTCFQNGGERQQLENRRFHWCMKNVYPKWCHLQKIRPFLFQFVGTSHSEHIWYIMFIIIFAVHDRFLRVMSCHVLSTVWKS